MPIKIDRDENDEVIVRTLMHQAAGRSAGPSAHLHFELQIGVPREQEQEEQQAGWRVRIPAR